MMIAVGSKSPAKVKAVEIVSAKLFPKSKIISVNAPSKVRPHPVSDSETIKGAINRAKYAIKNVKADFGIGMEGGMHKIGKDWFESGWIAVVDKKGQIGLGSSARFKIPNRWAKKILEGQELGTVVDEEIGQLVGKSEGGAVSIITNNYLTRYDTYSHGLILAFAPFISKVKLSDE